MSIIYTTPHVRKGNPINVPANNKMYFNVNNCGQIVDNCKFLWIMRSHTKKLEEHMNKYLSTKDVAKILGVSERGVTDICARGLLTFHRPGRSRLFKPADVEAYVESGKVEAVA